MSSCVNKANVGVFLYMHVSHCMGAISVMCLYMGREEAWEPDNVGHGRRGLKYHLGNPFYLTCTKSLEM